tara:strand:- start:2061 stop:3707 length:1647 start_codon:yes stop_codon:yes gene_type:complete
MSADASTYSTDFNVGFQRHILAMVARVPGFAVRCRDVLDPDYFDSDAHRLVAAAVLEHVDRFRDSLPSIETLAQGCRDLAGDEDAEVIDAAIREIYEDEVHDTEAVEERVIRFGKRQAMVNAVIAGASEIERGRLDRVESLVREAQLVGESVLDLGQDFRAEVESRVDRYLNPEIEVAEKIPTGVRHLDYLLEGGLRRGELGVILAPPKRGKSTVLINFGFGALASLEGLTVVHYSCEMSASVVSRRYDDRLLGEMVRQRRSDPEAFVAKLRQRVAMVHGQLFVRDYPTRSATPATLRAHLTQLTARGYPPDVVIVDYGQILRATERRKGDFRHEQASIYEDLRAIAGEFGCVVWSAVQANRASLEKDTITMADVSEAFEIAAVCDAMIALCQTPDERLDNICRLFAAAIRDAEGERMVECSIRRDSCRVTSRALFDAGGSKLYVPGDDEDFEAENFEEPSESAPKRKSTKAVGKQAKRKAAEKPKRKSAVSKGAKVQAARQLVGSAHRAEDEGQDDGDKKARRVAMPGSRKTKKPARRKSRMSKSIG